MPTIASRDKIDDIRPSSNDTKATLRPIKRAGAVVKALSAPKASDVFETYWAFAAKRQNIFFARAARQSPPWTNDVVLEQYRFTNAYRAADRVSQFLLQHVIEDGNQDTKELFFRIMLFKTFNKIETWRFLESHFGAVTWEGYSFKRYAKVIDEAKAAIGTVYSAAYIMPPGGKQFGFAEKHNNHLRLLELMINDDVPDQLTECPSMESAFRLLLGYPTVGPFLAFQYVIDLNYSRLTEFSEMSFVVAGPGAKSGLRKCFSDPGGYTESDLVRLVADSQEEQFACRGIPFRNLWGRRLQLIDCQNLFCEVDKYARVAHPSIGKGRHRIKQRFRSMGELARCRFPSKWGINDTVEQWYRSFSAVAADREGS